MGSAPAKPEFDNVWQIFSKQIFHNVSTINININNIAYYRGSGENACNQAVVAVKLTFN